MIAVFADNHWKPKEPYFSGLKKFMEWVVEKHKNDVVVFLGDLFDSSSPSWELYDIVLNYLLQIKEVHIIMGNHDYSYQKGNSLKSFARHPNIFVYDEFTEVNIEGVSFAMLPFVYTEQKLVEMEEIDKTYDFIASHLVPEKHAFGQRFFSGKIRGTVFQGHIHNPESYEDNLGNTVEQLGVPQFTRMGEEDYDSKYAVVDPLTKKYELMSIPRFLEVERIKFGEEPVNKSNLIVVENAPSLNAVHDQYPEKDGYFINIKACTVEVTETDIDIELGEKESLEQQFAKYAEEEGISSEVTETCLKYLVETQGQ